MNRRSSLGRKIWPTPGKDVSVTGLPCAVLILLLLSAGASFAREKRPNLPKQVQEAVKQANLILNNIDAALKANHFQDVQSGLQQYQALLETCLRDTREYRQTHKKTPRQFKDAEIKVRQQLRRLEDIRPGIPLPLRPELNKAGDTAKQLRHLFLGELFNITPPPLPPAAHSKPKDKE